MLAKPSASSSSLLPRLCKGVCTIPDFLSASSEGHKPSTLSEGRDWQHATGTYCFVSCDISEAHKSSASVSPITPPGARNSHCLQQRKLKKKKNPNVELSSQHCSLHPWGALTSWRSLLKCYSVHKSWPNQGLPSSELLTKA